MSSSFRLSHLFYPQMVQSGVAMVVVTISALVFLSFQFKYLETELKTLPDKIIPFDAAVTDLLSTISAAHGSVIHYLNHTAKVPHPSLVNEINLSRFQTQLDRQQDIEQQRRLGSELAGLRTEFIARGEALMARHDAWKLQISHLLNATRKLNELTDNTTLTYRNPSTLPSIQSRSAEIRTRLDAYIHTRDLTDLKKIGQAAGALLGLVYTPGLNRSGAQFNNALQVQVSEIDRVINEMLRLQQAQSFARSRFDDTYIRLGSLLHDSRAQMAAWKIAAPQQAVETSARRVFVLIAVLGLALLAVAMFALWRLARVAAEPLQELKQGVAMLGAGNLAHRVKFMRDDVFGHLIRDFNQMSDQLQQSLVQLQLSNTRQAKRIEAGTRELIEQTSHDPLTGLATRARLNECMEDAIAACRRQEGTFALLLLDLDGFKDVNVIKGHAHGDRLLRVIARRLQGQIQDEDLAARVSGDEFCLLLMDVDIERTTEFARRCLHALNAPIHLDGTITRPRASIGITFYPGDAKTPDELLKAADMAMYAAKNAGKHRYALYETGMTQKITRQLALETALREAVERGEFELHYQPQIQLGSGRMSGVEALIRWPRPNHGLVPPDEFIPVAERIGLINAIGVWVLETACRQAVMWHQEGLTSLVMAVNISPGHFESPDFTDTVARVLMVTGIAPQCLEIEVTESVTRDSLRHASISESLRRLGVRVAIDDFGTGYSSLAVLKKMPIDTLKLDRAFIRDMLEDSGSSMLIGTLIGMAKGLHLTTVAEGVETLEQVRVLTGLGCPMAQGYYFSRPVKADQIPELARTDFLLRANEPGTLAASPFTGTHGT